MTQDLRCSGNKLHGRVLEGNVFEVACRSQFCGWRRGVVILHRFAIDTGRLIETIQFKQPHRKEQG
jgi:hypothetical protein